jgi:hypothetical protein
MALHLTLNNQLANVTTPLIIIFSNYDHNNQIFDVFYHSNHPVPHNTPTKLFTNVFVHFWEVEFVIVKLL